MNDQATRSPTQGHVGGFATDPAVVAPAVHNGPAQQGAAAFRGPQADPWRSFAATDGKAPGGIGVNPEPETPKFASDLERAEYFNRQDRAQSRKELADAWGDSAKTNYSIVQQYVRNAPPAKREEALRGVNVMGVANHNDSIYMRKLVGEAIASNTMTRPEIEDVMRKDPKRYYGDNIMQARYRDLVR